MAALKVPFLQLGDVLRPVTHGGIAVAALKDRPLDFEMRGKRVTHGGIAVAALKVAPI